jgi:hypothetical protein
MDFIKSLELAKKIMSGEVPIVKTEAFLEAQKEVQLSKIWSFFDKYTSEYWREKRLSYSFLKFLDELRYPKPNWYGDSESRFRVGRAFEDLLTHCYNPENYTDITEAELQLAEKLTKRAQYCEPLMEAVANYEYQKTFEGVLFGYKFKCKLDFWHHTKRDVKDLKSTKEDTEKGFYKACEAFGYFTQGVIYKGVSGAETYSTIGTSKRILANFVVEFGSAEYEKGKKELLRLLENLEYFGISQYFKA